MTSASLAVSPQRNAYVALGLSMSALLAMYASTALSTVDLWARNPLGHGYLVVPAAAYFAWGSRRELASVQLSPTFWALPVLGILAFLWFLGSLTSTDIVRQACLVLMCIVFVWGVLGNAATRILAFSLGLLLFALPLVDRFVPMLQDFTARFAVKLLSLSGVPVLLQEHVISIPGSEWQVAEACSGINYLTSSLAVGYVYAGTSYRYWRHRIGFFAAAAFVPLVANGIRVYGTIWVAHLGGTGIAAGTRHYMFGWLIFAIMLAVLVVTCGNWRERHIEKPANGAIPSATSSNLPLVVFVVSSLLLLGIAPLLASLYETPVGPPRSALSVAVASPWRVVQDPYRWSPQFFEPTSETSQAYVLDGQSVKVHLAYFSAADTSAKVATKSNVLFEPPWVPSLDHHMDVAVGSHSLNLRETKLEGPEGKLLVWSWYWVDGRQTGTDFIAKSFLAKARIFRSPEGAAAIAIAAQERPGVDASLTLRRFLSDFSLVRTAD